MHALNDIVARRLSRAAIAIVIALIAMGTLVTVQSASAQTIHDVDAAGTVWEPDHVDAAVGDSVRWNWEPSFHDLHLLKLEAYDPDNPPQPYPDQDTDDYKLLSRDCLGPGVDICSTPAPPIVYQFTEPGGWYYFCYIHGGVGGVLGGVPGTGG